MPLIAFDHRLRGGNVDPIAGRYRQRSHGFLGETSFNRRRLVKGPPQPPPGAVGFFLLAVMPLVACSWLAAPPPHVRQGACNTFPGDDDMVAPSTMPVSAPLRIATTQIMKPATAISVMPRTSILIWPRLQTWTAGGGQRHRAHPSRRYVPGARRHTVKEIPERWRVGSGCYRRSVTDVFEPSQSRSRHVHRGTRLQLVDRRHGYGWLVIRGGLCGIGAALREPGTGDPCEGHQCPPTSPR